MSAAVPTASIASAQGCKCRRSIHLRLAIIVLLAAAADFLFYDRVPGISLPLFVGMLAVAAAWFARPRPARRGLLIAWIGLLAALLPVTLALSTLSIVAALTGVVLFTVAVNQRGKRDLADIAWQALAFSLRLPFSFLVDALRLVPRLKAGVAPGIVGSLRNWTMPLILSLVFLALFASANPMISFWLSRIDLFSGPGWIDPLRLVFWISLVAICWPFLRLRRLYRRPQRPLAETASVDDGHAMAGYFSEAAVIRALVLFNLLFIIHIGLDTSVLLAGTGLPEGMTYASYAHRGAYTLICTALLAAGFVLFAPRQGPHAPTPPQLRALVLLFTAQNVVLVGFCIHRLGLYVSAYALTYWRVAAFVWMSIVLSGLVLIFSRELLARSAKWLVEGNLMALAVILYVSSLVNVPGLIAHHNVAGALTAGGPKLDARYLVRLGPDAIPAIDQTIANRSEIRFWSSVIDGDPVADFLLRRRRLLAVQARARTIDWRAWSYRGHRLQSYLDTTAPAGVPMPATATGDDA